MRSTEALRWAGIFTALSIAATLIGLLFGVLGLALGGLHAFGMYYATPFPLRVAVYPRAGLLLIIIAVLAWWFGITAAFFKAFFDALDAELAVAFDTESLKSDILSVLDERLAEMHQEVSETRRVVDRMNREDAASEFEFGED